MDWDLGLWGLGLLLVMSLGFALAVQLLTWKSAWRWQFPIAAASFFVFGLVMSEGFFGWATEEDLQPNYDGLSFDEVLLSGLIAVALAVPFIRHYAKRPHDASHRRPTTPHPA